MRSDIESYRDGSLQDRMAYARVLAEAGLVPDSYQKNPANLLIVTELGSALGIAPAVAIQSIHVVKGRAVLSASLVGSLVRAAGHVLRVGASSEPEPRAWCEITRSDDPGFTYRCEWDLARARQAGLTGSQTWRSYPLQMLKNRAITECARDACPEVLAGLHADVELQDVPVSGSGRGRAGRSAEVVRVEPAAAVDAVEAAAVEAVEVVEHVL